ncbi:SpoIIE family protein phosphatase [Desulfofalx alkaliphila]|uniref:SpoIIE family protein phosphatase n=1 Tax=Desulfofalx alkaliphila TaxID=105483 RepID=UPI0004E1033B|nr:SpoIIE family protein phosphatase [Desulfofalx alkaliphila]
MKLRLDVGISQLKKHNEELCGDSVEVVRTENANIVVLSDGLGSGVKANILSQLTVKTAATMLKMGGHIDEVIETIACTLPTCQIRNLAYSTFSIAQVMDDGRTYLVEYDNPQVFVGHHNKMFKPRRVVRNIGEKTIKEYFFQMRNNDWLVMISDGVLHAGVGNVMNMGWGWERVSRHLEESFSPDKDATEWADEITQLCYNLYGEKPGDDTTVVVVKARIPNFVTIMIGPPRRKEDDVKVVEKLMANPGAKIVCGGTTGNIVGRILGREVAVDLSSNCNKIPPMGILPGIDLVTEGAVTLVYALEHLKYGTKLKDLKNKKDGASRLAALLLQADDIHFIVGTAENPALLGSGVPSIYTYKQHVIRDLIYVIKEKGKRVTEEYY